MSKNKPATETATAEPMPPPAPEPAAPAEPAAAPAPTSEPDPLLEALAQLEAAEARAKTLAAENEHLREQLARLAEELERRDAAPAPPPAPAAPTRPAGARVIGLRALVALGLALDGVRHDLVPGDEFEATEAECQGLVPGVHIELA